MAKKTSARGALKPRLVLITGASQGLGTALAEAYASALPGVRLALVARNAGNLAKVERRCAKLGADAHAFVCDVSEDAAVSRLPAAVTAEFGGAPDIVVNNAGSFKPAPLADTDAALFDAMIAANLRSAYLVTRAFLPALRKRGSGDLVFHYRQARPHGPDRRAARGDQRQRAARALDSPRRDRDSGLGRQRCAVRAPDARRQRGARGGGADPTRRQHRGRDDHVAAWAGGSLRLGANADSAALSVF